MADLLVKNIMDSLRTHKVVEANRSTGLRTGHIIADAAFAKPGSGVAATSVDNGLLFTISNTGAPALAVAADTKTLFMHYTEELVPLTGLGADREAFTVYYDDANVAYPRLVALYTGDVWTTTNYKTELADMSTAAFCVVDAGQLKAVATIPSGYAGHVFAINKVETLNGNSAVEVTFIA